MSLHASQTPSDVPATGTAPGGPAPDTGDRAGETAGERERRRAARALLLERTRASLAGPGPGRAANDVAWLDDCLDAVSAASADGLAEGPDGTTIPCRTFDLAFGLAPRRLGREPLAGDAPARRALRVAAEAALPGWCPDRWRVDEATRVLLLTAVPERAIPPLLARTLRHADLAEQLALYRALPLLPCDATVVACARRGLRGNVRAVFEAIAHDNPWPARHLDRDGWNQMVLKALFVESALAPVQGLDERTGARLAAMLIDYAHERRAAGRAIATGLWRALGPHATLETLAPFLPDASRGASGEALGRERWPDAPASDALALAAHASGDDALRALASRCAPRAAEIRDGRFGWTDICT